MTLRLQQLLGPRGGVSAAVCTIRARGGDASPDYLRTCRRGRYHAQAARIRRKHGVRVAPDRLAAVDRYGTSHDRLSVPASRLWRLTLDAQDRARREGQRVVRGGYRQDLYVGCGRVAVNWILRTATGSAAQPSFAGRGLSLRAH